MKLRKVAAITIAAAVMATMSVTAFAEGEGTPAEAVWVGAEEGSGTPEITPYILTESNNTVRLVSEPGKEDENPMNLVYSIDVTEIYGFRTYIQAEKNAWDAWHGGKVGTNSALGGWNEKYEYSTGAESPELTINVEDGIIEFVDDSPLFDDAEQTQGGYAQIWFQNWNGDNLKVIGYDLLDKDGNVITFETTAVGGEEEADAAEDEIEEEPEEEIEEETEDEIEEEPEEEVEEEIAEEEEEAPAPATGDVDAATDSSKGSPDTGVADVAAVAGIGVLAAGAAIVAKKRK